MQTPTPGALWRLPRVRQEIPVSRSTIYAWVAAGTFPAPLQLGLRCVAWRAEDVLAFIDSKR